MCETFGDLFVRSIPDGNAVRLYAERDNVFFVKEVEAQLTFTRDAHGTVSAVVLHQFGLDRTAPKIR